MSNPKIKATIAAAKAAGIGFHYYPKRRTISLGGDSYSVENGVKLLQSLLRNEKKKQGGARAGAGRPKGAARIHVSLRRDLHAKLVVYANGIPITEKLDIIVETWLHKPSF